MLGMAQSKADLSRNWTSTTNLPINREASSINPKEVWKCDEESISSVTLMNPLFSFLLLGKPTSDIYHRRSYWKYMELLAGSFSLFFVLMEFVFSIYICLSSARPLNWANCSLEAREFANLCMENVGDLGFWVVIAPSHIMPRQHAVDSTSISLQICNRKSRRQWRIAPTPKLRGNDIWVMY